MTGHEIGKAFTAKVSATQGEMQQAGKRDKGKERETEMERGVERLRERGKERERKRMQKREKYRRQ